jgi:hypothetical protein
MIRTVVTAVFTFFLLTATSCHNIFAPETGDIGKSGLLYNPVLSRPAHVLENFRYAYIYRDSSSLFTMNRMMRGAVAIMSPGRGMLNFGRQADFSGRSGRLT